MKRWAFPAARAGVVARVRKQLRSDHGTTSRLTASLDDESKSIRVSLGASIAFECTNQEGDPCARTASTTSASTALIFLANLDTLREWGLPSAAPEPRTVFVVVGLAEGRAPPWRQAASSLSVTVLP